MSTDKSPQDLIHELLEAVKTQRPHKSVPRFAEDWGISDGQAYKMIREGRLRAVHITSKKIVVPPDAEDEFRASLKPVVPSQAVITDTGAAA